MSYILSTILLPLIIISAPAPIPKVYTTKNLSLTEKNIIGIWYVKQSGYNTVWIFSRDGTWESLSKYKIEKNTGKWWIQSVGDNKDKQLRIRYGQTLLIHILGSSKYETENLILGDTSDPLDIEFVRKLSYIPKYIESLR